MIGMYLMPLHCFQSILLSNEINVLPMLRFVVKLFLVGLLVLTTVSNGNTQTLPDVNEPAFKKDTFNIIKYGAKADGITLNTNSISKAINACSVNGGGVVLVPHGLWLTGPLVLQSNINLYIAKDALLQFTSDF